MTKYVSELLASFLLVLFTIMLTVFSFNSLGTLGISFAVGMIFMSIIYIFSKKKIVQINPILSLAMLLNKKINFKDFCINVIMQILGAFLAVTLMLLILGKNTNLGANILKTLTIYDQTAPPVFATITIEIVISFFFVLTYLSIVSKKEVSIFSGMAIGLLVTAIYFLTYPITNGSGNPVYSLATAIFQGGKSLSQLYIFLIMPFIGSALGFLTFKCLHKDEERE